MTILELQEKRLNLSDELDGILKSGEAEARELNETENSRIAEIRTEIDNLDKEIEAEERKNVELNNQIRNKTNNNMEDKKQEVRLFDLIKEVANGQVKDEHRSFVNGNEIRAAIQATAEGMGEENIPIFKMPLDVAIRNQSVLNKLGARWITDATGDLKFPKYMGSNAEWADSENADAADGASGFTEVTLSPKRLTSYITISRQFLDQSPEDAESILIADLAKAVAEKLDKTIFGSEEGDATKPEGLFFSGATHVISGAPALDNITFDDVLAVENAVEEKNGTDFIFVTSPNVKYALRGTQTASGLQMVWDRGEIDGRKSIVSNSVEKGGLLCIDPADYVVATWGRGMNIIVDPYTLAGKNQIKVTINYLVDGKLKGDRLAAEVFE